MFLNSSAYRFIVPALLGVCLFLVPVPWQGSTTIVFAILTSALRTLFNPILHELLLVLLGTSALGASAFTALQHRLTNKTLAGKMFAVSASAHALRWLGFLITACVYFNIGPDIARLPDTGVTVVNDIGINVMIIYFAGLAFMPLLTNYGLMEFAGALCKPIFQPLFRLPGRAAIDTATSVVSASAIGLLLTLSQHEKGAYSAREASVIACNFSIVSIPFSLLIATVSGVETAFFAWYASVLFSCFICALILSRFGPLMHLADSKTAEANRQASKSQPRGNEPSPRSLLRQAWAEALLAASDSPNLKAYASSWLRDFPMFSMNVIGPSIAIATLASILTFHTPVVDLLVAPLRLLLDALGVQEAGVIAPALLIGFVDQFLPALFAGSIESEFWKFVLAGLSVTQLIFMSEFGLLVLRSALPLGVGQLLQIFLLRTAITLPLLMLCASQLTT